jgi:FixJ family two-component response regulator
MVEERAVVFVVDDDPSMRLALEDLVRAFAAPQEFLQSKPPDAPGCLVLDVRLPGMSGLTFQRKLVKDGLALPVIFITGHGDIPMSVRAMKAAAVEFLTKPFTERERQIMTLVVIGRANKQIAAELSLSEMTVKVHRGQVMRKMRAGSLPELVRMADRLGEPIATS